MSKESQYYRLAMKIFADFTGSIAIPAVLGALLGKWLDTRYGTSPKLMILTLVVFIGLTAIMIVRKTNRYKAEYESLNKEQQKDQETL